MPTTSKATLLERISERQADYIELCSKIVQIPTENPPGDTTALAMFLSALLRERGIAHQTFEPRPGNPLLVATIGAERGRHLVLNGHLDVFPADNAALWQHPPFSGLVKDGRLHGRGAADMKGGMTASLVAFLLLAEAEPDLSGRVSLALVSDEETGGAWGAAWLLDRRPEYIGDGLLNAEPTGLDSVWIGEKGIAWLRLISEGQTGHGSVGRGDNAITRLAEAVMVVRTVTDIEGEAPHDIETALRAQATQAPFAGAEPIGNLLTHCSVNVGTISGGIKTNIVPRHAEAEVDIRIPLGVTPEQVRAEVEARLRRQGLHTIHVEPVTHQTHPATVIARNDRLLEQLRANAEAVTGVRPALTLCPGATDARFWRARGIPTVVYGPTSHGMAESDEFIEIADYLATIRVHAATALDFLND